MEKTLSMFKASCLELKSELSIAMCAMLIAASIIFGFFSIQISPSIRIGFAFLPIAIGGYLYGPVIGAILGGATDILNFLIKPTGPFHLGFTLSAILTGFVFGLIYYRKKISIPRVILANVLVNLVINTLLNSYWLIAITGNPYWTLIVRRTPKEIIMLLINCFLYYTVVQTLQKSGAFKLIRK